MKVRLKVKPKHLSGKWFEVSKIEFYDNIPIIAKCFLVPGTPEYKYIDVVIRKENDPDADEELNQKIAEEKLIRRLK